MRRLAIWMVSVVVLGGCAVRQESRLPQVAGLAEPPPLADVMRAVAVRRDTVRSMRAVASMRYTSPNESRRAKQIIIAERPDRLRLEVLSPFGIVFVLAADDGTLAAYSREEATVYRGEASAENLARYAGVDLPIRIAVDLLLGTPPLDRAVEGVVSNSDQGIQLWQTAAGGAQVTWFTALLEPIRYEQRDEDGYVRLRATFDDYASVDGLRLPMLLNLELPASRERFEITFRDPEVNPVLARSMFALETPSGSREIDLDRVVR
jgi:outer membrane lipoprotein-sorting protein